MSMPVTKKLFIGGEKQSAIGDLIRIAEASEQRLAKLSLSLG